MAVYLDYNATTPIDERVLDVMIDVYRTRFGNADSRTHNHGDRAREIVERAREQVASLLGIKSGEVFFTSGATESNNIAIQGLEAYANSTGKKHIITTAIEHKAVLETAKAMSTKGFEVDLIYPDESGRISELDLLEKVRDDTLLVSVQHVNNEKGMINVLDSRNLIRDGRLYSAFLLWMFTEMIDALPVIHHVVKPKMVFFFDEAQLLFKNANSTLIDQIIHIVRMLRDRGVGVYFCSGNIKDIPDDVITHLGNRIQLAPHAYSTAAQKSLRELTPYFRQNPRFDTFKVLKSLGSGEAAFCLIGKGGIPQMLEKGRILPSKSYTKIISDLEREKCIKGNALFTKYAHHLHNPDSAYEFLVHLELEEKAAHILAKVDAMKAKMRAKEEARKLREEARSQRLKESAEKERDFKTVSSTVSGTVGRETEKALGSTFGGKFGRTLGGDLGASLGRGLFGTIFKK